MKCTWEGKDVRDGVRVTNDASHVPLMIRALGDMNYVLIDLYSGVAIASADSDEAMARELNLMELIPMPNFAGE